MLDIRQDDARRHLLDAGQLREFFEEKPLVGFDVFGDDSQQEVDVAEQHVAVHHFRAITDLLGKQL